ncbi:MAG: recombinase family protein, partial [Methyloceanibacter sp.]
MKALDDPSIDARSRTGKLVMGILALIAEFENDTRRERQMDGIAKAKDRGVKFGRKRELTGDKVKEIRTLRVGLLCNGSHTLSFSKVTPRASDGTHYADCLR